MKTPPHEKAAIVDMFKEFMGPKEFSKLHKSEKDAYTFWLSKVGRCTFGDAIEIVKNLESIPLEFSKGGAIINKLKKLNGGSKRK